jgi:hypothetical protein
VCVAVWLTCSSFSPKFCELDVLVFYFSVRVCVPVHSAQCVCVCFFFLLNSVCRWLGVRDWGELSRPRFVPFFFRFPTSTGFYLIPACVCVRIYPVLNRKSKKAPVCVYSPWTGEKETKIPERWIWFVLNEVDKISIRIFKNRKNQKDLSDRCRVIAEIDTRHHGSRRHIESP